MSGLAAIRPLILDLGCCGTSALHISTPGYSLPGVDDIAFELTPAQANVLIVAGRIVPALEPALQAIYARLAAPKMIIAYGTCAISGAVFDTIPTAQFVPVDLHIPGCPPHADVLHAALRDLFLRRGP